MIKKSILYIILLITGFGHSQSPNSPYTQPDLLIWKNDTIKIQTFPLNSWLKFDQKKLFENKTVETKYWGDLKNYNAEWKIIDGKLYLANIYSFDFKKDSIKTDLHKLFPNKTRKNLVFADWYSGNLFVPNGEQIWLSKSPEFPVYKNEWKITIVNGNIENKEFKSDNYYKSKYTKDTKNLVKFINDNLDEDTKNQIRKSKITILFETGKSKNDFLVSIKGIDNRVIENKFLKTLKKLPDFDYYYRNGKELNLTWIIKYYDNSVQ